MRTLSQRITLAVVAAATVVAGLAATAAPASAGKSDCRRGNMCTWEMINFEGYWARTPWQTAASYLDTPTIWHDTGSSWWNNTSHVYCVYDYVNGRRVTLMRLYAGAARATPPAGTNDRNDAVGWC